MKWTAIAITVNKKTILFPCGGLTRSKTMIVKTDPRYWDCDCDNNYIHKKSITLKCEVCNSEEDECSDSRPNEIKIYYKNYKEQEEVANV